VAVIVLLTSGIATNADESDLAKSSDNPLATVITVPFQFNYNQGFGTADGDQWLLNVQPIVPISLNENWGLVSRTIIPVKYQTDIFGKSGTQFGLGDTTESLWFIPKQSKPFGLTWGFGPVIHLPTATDPLLGAGKWGAGPTVAAVIQKGPWTIGGLANHVWSFGGNEINLTYLQPFVNYGSPSGWIFGLNTESTYDWNTNKWSIPINATVSKLVTLSDRRVLLRAGAGYHAAGSTGGDTDWRGRFTMTLFFPQLRNLYLGADEPQTR